MSLMSKSTSRILQFGLLITYIAMRDLSGAKVQYNTWIHAPSSQ